jgi:hypothetical protein
MLDSFAIVLFHGLGAGIHLNLAHLSSSRNLFAERGVPEGIATSLKGTNPVAGMATTARKDRAHRTAGTPGAA